MAGNDNDDDAASAVDDAACLHMLMQQDQVLVQNPNAPDNDNRSNTNNTIQSVTIVISDSFTELTEAGIRTFEETLAAHANVRYINLERLTHATTSIPVRALIRILRLENLGSLTDLRILGTNLQGSREEWQELAHVLRDSLQSLEFICIVEPLAWLAHIPLGALDPLVRVCAGHSKLKFVATNLFSGVSLDAIDDFCRSKQIMGLHLVDIDVSGGRVYRFLNQMQSNTKVWFLSLAFSESMTTAHARAMAQLLRNNKMIANLSIKSKQSIQDNFLLELVQGLGHSGRLEEFSLEGSGQGLSMSKSSRTALADMLERNRTLHKLELEGVKGDGLAEEIEMFMNLNRGGRRKLLGGQTTSTEDWIDTLGHDAVKNDLSCIYYLLSKNPGLLCCQREQKQAVPSRKRKHGELSATMQT